jgi:hypothetical protein
MFSTFRFRLRRQPDRRTGADPVGRSALLVCLVIAGGVRAAAPAAAPVALHQAVGDTLDAREAARFGLFADEPGLRWAVVLPAPWGGTIVRLSLATLSGTVIRERNLPTARLRAWRSRIDAVIAGGAVAPDSTAFAPGAVVAVGDTLAAATDTLGAVAPRVVARHVPVWPEVPLPPARPRPPGLDGIGPGGAVPAAPARWLVATGIGYRHCGSDFGRFFTDMGLIEIAVTHRLGRSFSPYAAFQYGFGDIQDAFEAVSQNGRSAIYGLEMGLITRAPVSRGAHAYFGFGGGYYMRSLRWGGEPFVGADGVYYGGTLIRELQNWGVAAKLGVQLALPATGKGKKERLLDIQLRLEDYARSSFEPFGADSELRAAGRDRWYALSVSLLTGL